MTIRPGKDFGFIAMLNVLNDVPKICRNKHPQKPEWSRCLICKREADLRYRHSEKGRANRAQYEKGEAAKKRKARYESSGKGRSQKAQWYENLSGVKYNLRCLRSRRANALTRRRNRKELNGKV